MKLSNILFLMVFILILTHDAKGVSLTGDAASTSLVEIIAVEAVLTNDAGRANLTDYIAGNAGLTGSVRIASLADEIAVDPGLTVLHEAQTWQVLLRETRL